MRLTTALARACLLAAVSSPVLAQTLPLPYNFNPVKIIAGGYIPGLIAHPTQPELFYLRTDIGGVYRFSAADGDTQWQPLLDAHSPDQYNLNGPESIAVDPTDSNKLYVAAGMYAYANCCAFLVSNDRGRTFQTYPAPFQMAANGDGRPAGERLAVNPFKPSELMMGTRYNGLWKSENNAQTWTQVASFPVQSSPDGYGVHWVVFDPKTSGTVYVGSYTSSAVYVSTDDGSTWTALPALTWPAAYNAPASTHPPAPERGLMSTDGNLYVTFDDTPGPNGISFGLVEKYNPQAKTWTDITPPLDSNEGSEHGGFVGLSQAPGLPGTIATSTMDRWYPVDSVYVTKDAGADWFNLGYMASISGDDGNPYGNYYFNPSTYQQTPYLTFGGTNGPNSPVPSAKFGWWISGVLFDPSNPNTLAYGTGATLYGTSNLSNVLSNTSPDFTVLAQGIEETAVTALISPKSGPAHLLSGLGDIGGFQHTDFTKSPAQGMYTSPVATTTGSLDWAGQAPNVIVRTASPTTASSTPCNYGGYSVDGGTTWKPSPACAAGVSSSYNGGYLAVDASATTVIWTPGPSTDMTQFSTDRGQTWHAVTGLPNGTIVSSDKVTPEVFYAYANGTSYRGKVDPVHGIAAFTQVSSGLPQSAGCYGSGCGVVDVDWNRAGSLWLPLGSSGLYHSIDGGSSWTALSNAPYANSVAIGAPAPWNGQDAVFLYGRTTADGPTALYRSDDTGASWTRINDDAHQYGGPTLIQADPRVWGRVYLGMNGRGIIYGSIAGLPDLP